MEFATPPNYRKNSNFLTIDLKSPITKFSSRQSLVSPSSAHIALTENLTGMLNSRKSSIVNGPLSVRESPQLQMSTNALSLLALGKMRQKAAQTKEFIKSQAAPRLGMIELTIHNSEIAKIVLKVLMKPGDQRTVTETNFLIKTLKNESYFMKIREKSEKDVFHKLFYEARHMFYPKMKIIYRNGDLTKKALLVIEGEIWVMKLKKDKSEPVVIENLSQTLQKSTDFLKSKEYIMKNFPDFQVIEVLKEGGNVGLQCLFNEKDEFMSNLIIAKENTHFLAIQKESYNRLKDAYKNKILNEKLEFLKSYAMFAKWSTKSLKTLLDSCEIQLYHYNQTVFKENELSTHLYLIKHGEIEISRIVHREVNSENFDFDSLKEMLNQAKTKSTSSFNSMNRIWSSRERKQSKQRITVTKLCQNQFFGEKEVYEKDSILHRTRSTVKSEDAEIYAIPKQKFLETFSHLNSLKCLKALADAKENWRDNLIAKAKRGFSSQGMKNRKNSTLECFENNFQLISHVKDHKLLDKEFQVLKGKQPIRGNFDLKLTSNNLLNPKQTYLNSTERSRPFTARETQKDAITDKNHNKSFENDNVCEELDLNLWNNSPKNRDKKQKELDRKLNYGKHKKKDNAGYSDLFMTNINKHQNDRAFQEKVEKIKIFKRLRIDKMFPLRQFSFH